MNSHPLPRRRSGADLVLITTFSFSCLFMLTTFAVTVQGQPVRVRPNKLQQTPPKPPFSLFEDEELKKFDSLPKAEQEARLATKGPLFPREYNSYNFSTRVFVNGNSPLLIDYALQPNSTALLLVTTDRSKLVFELKQSDSFRNEVLSHLDPTAAPGNTVEQRAIAAGAILLTKFLISPEKARQQVIVDLPAEFSSVEEAATGPVGRFNAHHGSRTPLEGKPAIAKLSIQAFTEVNGVKTPAYFRLYGLGVGEKAVATIRRRDLRLAHHAFTLMPQSGGATAIDQIKFRPGTIRAGSAPGVRYEIHSRSAFYNVAVLFNRDEDKGNISFTKTVYYQDLGSITENGWKKPEGCKCAWDGKGERGASLGWHVLEVHAWEGEGARYWATARSYPKRVLVK
jgi:hypothetical protein